ncbi:MULTISPECIES: hypothetical protein [Gordonia]|uniref:hypothetical protein n=1 Tax=Gordonia TaxID=2053 RepID=UPI002580CB5A|nr:MULTISPECIES: hypothetical protein [Gordonia]
MAEQSATRHLDIAEAQLAEAEALFDEGRKGIGSYNEVKAERLIQTASLHLGIATAKMSEAPFDALNNITDPA